MNKGFWMTKGPGHENDANSTFDGPSLLDSKRAHHWFVDGCETQVFPNKKQAIQSPNSKMTGGLSNMNVLPWEQHSANYQSVSHQLIGRLFGPESVRSTDFDLTKASPVISDSLDLGRKGIEDQYGEDASVGLSISHGMEDSETSLSYGGIRKVKINQVKDNLHGLQASLRNNSSREDGDQISIEGYYKETETGLASAGSAYIKEDDSFNLMNQPSNDGDHHIRFLGPGGKVDGNVVSIGDDYGKRDANIISFGGFPDEQDIISLGRSLGSHDPTFYESSFQSSEAPGLTELESSNFDVAVAVSSNQIAKQKPDTTPKSRPEYKMRKEAPNSFPSNVRSLITTGMLDGVPVKYVSVAREELRGIINGSGYLCGCQSCNFSKMLNAYEFERHAGCKTKHPNNHIYFENGKTIYQIVQELRSTPESMLFDTIQTIFGAPINQKSFRSWKESFQAATRELQRIYGKEELNL
ncbi:uncharacterized protein LOC111017029 [Momordica charantia]|uniref:Uncharacterized protein LOC111017029 n=1 Tax=Momordica charantia TaxID=3673 RepID=A0A6J1D3S1_MOMCH|nr:uncharacterized protein LOC111017029 [Momordica charantia]XP_022148360.1 uncharacterized protein LOC111017029 [Momordica charantia]